MNYSRRDFLAAGGTALLATTAGCGRVPEILIPGGARAKDEARPFQPPDSASLNLISHCVNRLSFGPRPGDYERVRRLAESEEDAAQAYLEEQLHPEGIDDSLAERAVRGLTTLHLPAGELFEYREHIVVRELVHATLLRAVFSRRQLHEVMVHFWTDHFNIHPSKGDCAWLKLCDDRDVVRKHALGDAGVEAASRFDWLSRWTMSGADGQKARSGWTFREMVRASALSPAMLWYLDGRDNRKERPHDQPNENYARELLELHTLGVRGGYTQKDVMEVARCLTGWTVRHGRGGPLHFGKAKVEFHRHLHDDGEKVVLGHRIPAGLGAEDLDRVLDIVCTHPSTARHLAAKLCRRFVADDPPRAVIEGVANAFQESKGDIRQTLRALFATDAFRTTRGNKLKRPFHFVVSALRATSAQVLHVPNRDNDGPLYQFLRSMGHMPFDYPTPDGYPEEPAPWLSGLLERWKFALALSENRVREARINLRALITQSHGERQLVATLLGRRPTTEEMRAYRDSENGLALALACPAFQQF